MFLLQMTLGASLGYGMGRAMVALVNVVRLEYEGLYPVFTVALVLLTYEASAVIGGNGFLAVYITGLVMGNCTFIHKKSLRHFHNGLAWLMQITMFFTPGVAGFPVAPRAGRWRESLSRGVLDVHCPTRQRLCRPSADQL